MERKRRVAPRKRSRAELAAEAEFKKLYRELRPGLMRYARRLMWYDAEFDVAEDVLQDAFLKFWKQRTTSARAKPGQVPSRLKKMVKDAVIDRLRAARRHARNLSVVSGESAAMRRRTSATRATDDHEIVHVVREALEQMYASWREPWIRCKEEDLSIAEAAQLLGMSEEAVRAGISHANNALRIALTRRGFTPRTLRGRDDR